MEQGGHAVEPFPGLADGRRRLLEQKAQFLVVEQFGQGRGEPGLVLAQAQGGHAQAVQGLDHAGEGVGHEFQVAAHILHGRGDLLGDADGQPAK